MSTELHESYPTETPNAVLENPSVRRVVNVVLGIIGIIIGTVTVVDASTAAFDLTPFTIPATVGYAYLAAIFGLAITTPNIPKHSA